MTAGGAAAKKPSPRAPVRATASHATKPKGKKTKKKAAATKGSCAGTAVCIAPATGKQTDQVSISAAACAPVEAVVWRDPATGQTIRANAVRAGGTPPRCVYKASVPPQFCVTARQYKQGADANEHDLQVSVGTGGPHVSFKLKCKTRTVELDGSATPQALLAPGASTIVVFVYEPGSKPKNKHLPPAKPKPGKKSPPPVSNKAPGSKQAVPGAIVTFTTDFGTLSAPTATADRNGIARVTLTSQVAGTAHVKATIPARKIKGKGTGAPISTTVGVVFGTACTGQRVTLLDDTNGAAVDDGGAPPTFTTHGKAYCLDYIQTYHWNSGGGAPPGTLGLNGVGGTPSVGPFPAQASAGQDNAPNVNWYVYPPQTPPTIIDGTYACSDSGAATWSSNKESGGRTFCIVQATPVH